MAQLLVICKFQRICCTALQLALRSDGGGGSTFYGLRAAVAISDMPPGRNEGIKMGGNPAIQLKILMGFHVIPSDSTELQSKLP